MAVANATAATAEVSENAAPSLQLSVSHGKVGDSVTITGAYFTTALGEVSFGGTKGEVAQGAGQDIKIVVKVPAGAQDDRRR